jgi:hypothetical protein
MKPRYRPGKAATGGRAARSAIAKSKPLSANEIAHIKEEKPAGSMNPKAGRKGKRANWDIDYAQGVEFDMKPMPCREPESFTIDGVRRWPKRGS